MFTRQEFAANAKSVVVIIDGVEFQAEAREFSTGSLGWYLGGKGTVQGQRVQIGINLTIIGSKELPKLAAGTSKEAAPAADTALAGVKKAG